MPNRLFLKVSLALTAGLGGLLILLGLTGFFSTARAADRTVCLQGPPTCAFASIQAAVDAAGPGDVIKVAAGVYTGVNNRGGLAQMVYLDKSVIIQGGYTTAFTGPPDPEANPTTLDAQGQGRVFYVNGDISPVIEGFRITGGDSTGLAGDPTFPSDPYDAGGGLYVITAAAVIRHNEIFSNTSSDVGGGVYLLNSDASLSNNTIISNTTWSGSVYLESSPATLSGNYVARNVSSHSGGGLSLVNSSVSVIGNEIISNSAGYGGGGVIMGGSGASVLEENTIAGNQGGAVGGGLILNTGAVILKRNKVVNNRAGDNPVVPGGGGSAGGLFFSEGDVTLINNMIAGNSIVTKDDFDQGSGVYMQASTGQFRHNTVAHNEGNSGVYVSESSLVTLTNTILTNHQTGLRVEAGSTALVEGVLWFNNSVNSSGSGAVAINTDYFGDPAFVDPGNGDYHIGPASAALDKGVAAGVAEDIDGQSRDALPDLGADERSKIALSVAKTAPAWTVQGAPVTYTLTVANKGQLSAANPVITDAVPVGAHLVRILDGGQLVGDVVQWTISDLGPNQSRAVRFVVTATETIANRDYAVRAGGGYRATGKEVVVAVLPALPPTGGSATLAPGVTLTTGDGVFSDAVLVIYTPQPATGTGALNHVGLFYDLSAVYASTGQPALLQPGRRYTITVTYDQANVPSDVDEADLALYYWDGTMWVKEATSVVDSQANTVAATPDHFSLWAVLAERAGDPAAGIFLPVIIKSTH